MWSARLWCIFLTILLSACSEKNDNEPPSDLIEGSTLSVKSGVLLDGVIQGVSYVSSSELKGVTDKNGLFQYIEGQKVCFSIGKLSLGCAHPVDKPVGVQNLVANKVVTPLGLAGAGSHLNDLRVLNRVRFFLTLDKDKNADNGIQIDSQLTQSLQTDSLLFDASFNPKIIFDEATALTGESYHLIDTATARTHLCHSLKKDNCMDTEINRAPIATTQSIRLLQGSQKAITLVGSDAENSPLSYEVIQTPAHGTLTGTAPNLSYTPAANYHGHDHFSFRVNDGRLYSAPVIVSIAISMTTYPDGFKDTIPPVITLNGNNPISLQQNTSYTEQGASAIDLVDGNINVVITGAVDTNKTGNSSIIYTATDKAGNTTSIIRSVIILAPALKRIDALTFLGQAAFSSRETDIQFIKEQGYEQWIDVQLAIPYTPNEHLKRTIRLAKKLEPSLAPNTIDDYLADNEIIFNQSASFNSTRYQMSAWFETVLFSQDQLRQRVAYALSQIIVESLAESIFTRRGEALAHYFDILTKNALGNYSDLLTDMTHSASMGLYLTYNGSKKQYASGNTIIYPDENYAREIMQLFTIGLKELNLDGTAKLDGSGNPIPTYSQQDVNELARVFTGWDLKRNKKFGRISFKQGDFTQPLEFTSEYHDEGEKKVLGQTVLAGNTGTQDIAAAIDILMNHSNVAPFISKQLIMRLVDSNPSPSYIKRVATVFNDNGEGVKGDLKAVVKAIFLDSELVQNRHKKKYKEPLIAYTQFLGAFKAKSFPRWRLSGGEEVENALLINDPSRYLGQAPSRSPTVFNFYSNNYIPNNTAFIEASLVAPEIQIQTDSVLISFNNRVHDNLLRLEKRYLIQKNGSLIIRSQNIGTDRFLLDCTEEYEVIEQALEGSVNGVFESFDRVSRANDMTDSHDLTARDRALKALILHLDNKLTGGDLSEEQKNTLFEGYKDDFYTSKIGRAENPEMDIMKTIIRPIIAIIVTSEINMAQ